MKIRFDSSVRHKITEANINYYAAPFTHPARKMQEHDFIYLLDGEWKIGQNKKTYSLCNDSLLILNANQRHYGISPCRQNTRTMYFHVSAESGDSCFEETDNVQEGLQTLTDVSHNRNIKKIFYEIVHTKLSGNDQKAAALFDLLICELTELEQHTHKAAIGEQIKAIIHRNPECFFGNNELAAKVGVSVKNAETKFKAQFGVTIHQYILQFKIQQAEAYLKNFPEMSMREIAYNLGFYDEYHFSRQFKRITGISPRQYRSEVNFQYRTAGCHNSTP